MAHQIVPSDSTISDNLVSMSRSFTCCRLLQIVQLCSSWQNSADAAFMWSVCNSWATC